SSPRPSRKRATSHEEVCGMVLLLSLAALIVALLGALFLTQATMGVGILAGACLLAIFARIVQAAHHHAALLRSQRLQRGEDPRSSLEGHCICWSCCR